MSDDGIPIEQVMEEECKNSWADESAKEENTQHESNNLHDTNEEDQINTTNSISKPPVLKDLVIKRRNQYLVNLS